MSIKAVIYCNGNTSDYAPAESDRLNELLNQLALFVPLMPPLSSSSKTSRLSENRQPGSELASDTQKERKIFLIAVDGGANTLYNHGLLPDIIIGDMDSIDPEILNYYQNLTRIEIHPEKKEATDTELALEWCIKHGLSEILIINDLQGDFAHSAGTMMLLFKAKENGIKAGIYNLREFVFLIPPITDDQSSPSVKEWTYRGTPGRKLSLIPLSGSVTGILTSGLAYPLRNETLYRNSTRGVSNVFVDAEIKICYENGELLGVMESSFEELL